MSKEEKNTRLSHLGKKARTEMRFSLLLVTFTLTCALVVVKVLSYNSFYIPWPGRQILPSILYLKGYLQKDFYAMASEGSIYAFTASGLSRMMWGDLQAITFQYSVYSIFFEIGCVLLTTLLIWRIMVDQIPKGHHVAGGGSIVLAFLLPVIPVLIMYHYSTFFEIGCVILATFLIWRIIVDQMLKGHDAVRGRRVALALLLPAILGVALAVRFRRFSFPEIAGWGLPFEGLFNPQGISWFATACAVTMVLFVPRFNPWISVTVGVVGFCAGLIHPVIPLVGVLLLGRLAMLASESAARSKALRGTYVLLLACMLAFASAMLSYPNVGGGTEKFYQIYVMERHPHHYLPSEYMTSWTVMKLAVYVLVVLGFLSLTRRLSVLTVALVLALAIGPHLAQYLLVERLQVNLFITLGPSRLIYAFNVLYISALIGLVAMALNRLAGARVFNFFERIDSRFERWLMSLTTLAALALLVAVPMLNLRYTKGGHEAHPAVAIAKAISQAGWQDHPVQSIIVDKRASSSFSVEPLRELGGLAVYSDSYFPFSRVALEEWSARRAAVSSVERCLAQNNAEFSCLGPLEDAQLVVITKGTSLTTESIQVSQNSGEDFWLTRIGSAAIE